MSKHVIEALLEDVAAIAGAFRNSLPGAKHLPSRSAKQCMEALGGPLPEQPEDPQAIIRQLAQGAAGGNLMMTAPRFFGWVMGASHPVGVAADALTKAWGQMGAPAIMSPAAGVTEEITEKWLLELLDLPPECSVGFVSGATVANFTCLAAARGEVLRKFGWDADEQGLFGAPPITVIMGEEAHSTVFMALQYLGLGHERVVKIKSDNQGRMDPGDFAATISNVAGPIIVILQAGHINSGAFDDFAKIIPLAKARGAWVHVDGAFGLWAKASPALKHLAVGVELADSWATDGHKWLQVPYDCGFAIVRHELAHRRAMSIAASYLPTQHAGERIGYNYVPELSRSARSNAVWAVIKAFGRSGITEMVDRHCRVARLMSEKLAAEPGIAILNDVVLNQVAVRFGADRSLAEGDELTKQTIRHIQQDGTCFAGGANWRGQEIMRISVTSQLTNEQDGLVSVEAMISAWRRIRAG